MTTGSPASSEPGSVVYPELKRRLLALGGLFDLEAVRKRDATPEMVRQYYRESSIGYSLLHSREGSIHMSLEAPELSEATGYEVQPDLVLSRIMDRRARSILELGCGKGYNLKYIGSRAPDVLVTGIDLSPKHVNQAGTNVRDCPNVSVAVGDFSEIVASDCTYDLCYSVESLCHAVDPYATLLEIARVTKTHGHLIVIDAWRTDAATVVDQSTLTALDITERSMSVGNAMDLRTWLSLAERSGWRLRENTDLSIEVMANLEKLESLASRFLKRRRLARLVRYLPRRRLFENVIAGFLMAESVRQGLHTYRLLVLQNYVR